METQENRAFQLRLWQHCVVFSLSYLVFVVRRPDAIFHAQFCAEDGFVWFSDAYNRGWLHALMLPWTGIFMTVPRLACSLALLVPLAWAPLVTNAISIAIQALPVNLLLNSRSSGWGSFPFRALLAVAYLALPDCSELSYGISWAQWPLALCSILVIVSAVPRNWVERAGDCVLFVLSGLSGPACILFLPITAFIAWRRKERWRWTPFGVLAGCALVQMYALVVRDPTGRPTQFPLGANLEMFTRIFGGNVILGALLGRTRLAIMPGYGALLFLAFATAAGLAIMIVVFFKAEMELKLFMVFASMLLFVSLVRPTAYPTPGTTVWEMFAQASDIRYWVMPSLAFAWCVLWCARSGTVFLRIVSVVLLFVMSFSAAINWKHPALPDLQFVEFARAFEASPPGTVMIIPENPTGWQMRLVKHADR
jgi:hypothetical protein